MRRTLLILFAAGWAGTARAEMPQQELVDALAALGAPETARSDVEAGRAPVWIFEPNTGVDRISVAGVVALPRAAKQIQEDLFARASLLDSDLLKASGTFSAPAVAGDVAGYRVPESDVEALADCEVHACKFKLGERALTDLGVIEWDAPDASGRLDALVRGRLVEFVAAYQKDGRAALGRYLDRPDARSVEEATDVLLDQMQAQVLKETVRAHLAGYPRSHSRGARDRLHWNVRDYGYRPVTSIVHTAAFDPEAGTPASWIAAETLYSSHYFDARLQLLVLYADATNPDRTYALYGDRMLFDDEVGGIQRKMLRSGVVKDVRVQLGEVGASYATR